MLTNPDIDVMLHNEDNIIGNKFALITLVAKRAANLRSGNPPLVDVPCRNPVSIALHEIAQGKVSARHPVAGETSPGHEDDAAAAALAAALGHISLGD
jgi:DNA-directed RNA polymerase omega subunit